MSDQDFEEPAALHAGIADGHGRDIKLPFKDSCTARCGNAHGDCKKKGPGAKCDYPKSCHCEKLLNDN